MTLPAAIALGVLAYVAIVVALTRALRRAGKDDDTPLPAPEEMTDDERPPIPDPLESMWAQPPVEPQRIVR